MCGTRANVLTSSRANVAALDALGRVPANSVQVKSRCSKPGIVWEKLFLHVCKPLFVKFFVSLFLHRENTIEPGRDSPE